MLKTFGKTILVFTLSLNLIFPNMNLSAQSNTVDYDSKLKPIFPQYSFCQFQENFIENKSQDLQFLKKLKNFESKLKQRSPASSWSEFINLKRAIKRSLGEERANVLNQQIIEKFMSKFHSYFKEDSPEKTEMINDLEILVKAGLIHQKRIEANDSQSTSFLLQNSAIVIGAGLIGISLYLALAGGISIISSPIILVGIIAATGAAGVPLIKNTVKSFGESHARSEKYKTSFKCEQSEYFKKNWSEQSTQALVGFGAGLLVGGLIALLPPVTSLILAPLMAGYIGFMAYKEFNLAYQNYYGELGYLELIKQSSNSPTQSQASILRDHANSKLTKVATDSTVGVITLGLFALVMYEGIVFIGKSQQKALLSERQKLDKMVDKLKEFSKDFKAGKKESGSRSANLEVEEASAVIAIESEGVIATSEGIGVEGQMAEMVYTSDAGQGLSSLLQNFTGQGSGSEIFYSELSAQFAKLLELSSNDAAMIAHKMIDKHLIDKAIEPTAKTMTAKDEFAFLSQLFGLGQNPLILAIKR